MEDIWLILLVIGGILYNAAKQFMKKNEDEEGEVVILSQPKQMYPKQPQPQKRVEQKRREVRKPATRRDMPRPMELNAEEQLYGKPQPKPLKRERDRDKNRFVIQPPGEDHLTDMPVADTTEEYAIRSEEDARRAIIWGEILQRKY